jgi:hypothetical protein
MKTQNSLLRTLTYILFLWSVTTVLAQDAAPWENLFDGKTLNGWERLNGTAEFTVQDEAILGTTSSGSPNSFLCTKKMYGNFILELDFKVDEALNSGIQIRSQSLAEFKNGRVHGYQIEIDPAQKEMYSAYPSNLRADGSPIPPGAEPRRWTGGIYDEGRRGWLRDLSRNEAARMAFKPGAWNHLRIEALGDGIRTWINGVFAAGFADAMTSNGFIGLQVHATKSDKPLRAQWKNIRIKNLGFNDAQSESHLDPYVGDWIATSTGRAAQVALIGSEKYRAILLSSFDIIQNPLAVMEGTRNADGLEFSGTGHMGKIEDDRFTWKKDGEETEMRHVSRSSPTLNAPPPDNAIVLFDGRNVDEWSKQKSKEWLTQDGPATNWRIIPGGRLEVVPASGSIITKRAFGDLRLHAEFRLLGEVTNSGLYLMTRYEINIKDSYGQTAGTPCATPGNIVEPELKGPVANAAAPPFHWQTLDIEFRAPRFDQAGAKTENARITVVYNGVPLYENFQPTKLKGAVTRLGEAATGPLMIQEHGTALQFRNIWIVDLSGSN